MATLSNEVTNKFEREMVYAYALKPELLKTYPCDKKFFKNTLFFNIIFPLSIQNI